MEIGPETTEIIDLKRRLILNKGATFLMGSFLGLNPFSTSHADRGSVFLVDKSNLCQKNVTHTNPQMALIIDDIGNNISRARQFLDIGIPITYSILPQLAHSSILAEKIFEEGHEIMLHQPMEPCLRGLNPGPGALYVDNSPEGILEIIEKNLLSVPLAVGVNNHMGSRFTSHEKKMEEALEIVKARKLFFIDSITSSQSAAYRVAKRLNITSGFRNIFLDNYPDEQSVIIQLRKLKAYALKYGHAIGIGHPHRCTAQAIRRFSFELNEANISLIYVSNLIER